MPKPKILKSKRVSSEGALDSAIGKRGRRGAIVSALRRLILEKGYAETTLTDLAHAVGMSVSHFLYYFPSKEAVLEELCAELLTRLLTEVNSHREAPPLERIQILVELVFTRDVVPRADFGFLIEIVALSLHYPRVRKLILDYYRGMMDYLTELFRNVPRAPGHSPEDAATVAAGIWEGLIINSLFDQRLGEARARLLFKQALLGLAGLESPESGARGKNPSLVLARSTIRRSAPTHRRG
jgi:AcrR family transcriptional regulator